MNDDLVILQSSGESAGTAAVHRRVVPRALGKWRGSTLAGYLTHDDTTFLENFRCTRQEFDGLVTLLQGSALDSMEAQRDAQQAAQPRAARWTKQARVAKDPPTLRFKVGLCLYCIGHGGPVKPLADVGSVGVSALRRYLSAFAQAVMASVGPIYMPSTPMAADERLAVQQWSMASSTRG